MALGAHEAIRARRTIHDFDPAPVAEDVLRRALEAAHQAPCHKLTWPWRFTRVGPKAREHLVALNLVLKGAHGDGIAKLRAKMTDPPVLLVVSQALSADPVRRQEDQAACACAVQNLAISLAADGVGCKWGTGRIATHPDTYAAIGVDPEHELILGFLWIGRPSREHRAPERPPLEAVVREVP